MKTKNLLIIGILFAALLTGCGRRAQVGELQSESQSVELTGDKSVDVNIDFGAGDLKVTSGASKLLQADFNYNVAELKPVVKFNNGSLLIQQPAVDGLPILQGITDFRNEWDLHLADQVPMKLKVNMGAGNSNLQLAGLSLTQLDVILGAGKSTVDLNGDWLHDMDITMDAGATDLTVRLPKDVGVRVEVDRGPTAIDAPGFLQNGDVYTNTAYGVSDVTLQLHIKTGIGLLDLELIDN